MSRQNRSKLYVSAHCVYTFFVLILCLAQTACQPNDKKDKPAPSDQVGQPDESPQEPPIAPDKFRLKLDENEHTKSKKNFVTVTITPGSSGMELSDLYITASVSISEGTLKGADGKRGKSFNYGKDLNNQSLEELYLISANCLGKDDSSFKQGKPVQVKLEYVPSPGTPQGTEYTLTVKIERQGSNPHTEKSEVTLTRK